MNKRILITCMVICVAVIGLVRGINLYQHSNIAGCTSGTSATCNKSNQGSTTQTNASDNIVIVNGKQEITITAGHGYTPQMTIAKANMPTTIKFQGKNAYGCESSINIPSLDYTTNIDANGLQTKELPPQSVGKVIDGTCGMGMYSFQIKFE